VVVWLVLSLPMILAEAASAVTTHAGNMALALALGQPTDALLSLLAILLLALPALGSLLILGRLARSLTRTLRKRFFAPPVVRTVPRHAAPPRRFGLVKYRF
jgi:hypothetical protein